MKLLVCAHWASAGGDAGEQTGCWHLSYPGSGHVFVSLCRSVTLSPRLKFLTKNNLLGFV